MIATATPIAHGAAMTNYATKHNRADIVLTRNFDEGLTPLAMWGAMETIHQKYEPKFRRKPVKNPTLRMEVSPSKEETRGWTLEDWHRYTVHFLEEFQKAVQSKDGKKKGAGKYNLAKAQIFACLHHDAKSGIPHLHIIINRIDLDSNLMSDSFVGERAMKAAHAINVERGWELPEDIHEAHVKEITDACRSILEKMPSYDWNIYKHHLEQAGYSVKEQRDKQGVLHGYTIIRGNSRFKSSILGKSRNLTVPKLESTWRALHPAPKVVQPSSSLGTYRPEKKKPFTERPVKRPMVVQPKPEVSSIFRRILSVDDKNYSITMPLEAYKAMDDAIEVPDESVRHDDILKVAMLLFMGYVDAATSVPESCGGGGGTSSGWGKDKDEDDRDWARRCAQHANWLCKPIRKHKGQGR